MGAYALRVGDSILPLSVDGTLPTAFGEWSFTENTVHHEQSTKLCGQQDLGHNYEIANQYTEATLWVGSHCLLQFDVAVLEKGRRLSPAEAKRHLTKLTQQMQLASCIRTLEQLAAKESNPILSGALDYRRKNKSSPQNMPPLFSGSSRFSNLIITRRPFRSSFVALGTPRIFGRCRPRAFTAFGMR
ncbi:hypothetical protein [Rhizobium tumorigenes]|uniref:Uncharacterized protein n=1 Tax=Rhizobium tumorigenes TaxID=2041385 RepID=A0AAF1KMB5_9HYPH|nr:hypothetical protein [Rhizobium tumorigenes]WFR97773.1 hypothetical protein PR017_17820 [Rhizobium tumorigenes]